MVSSTPRPYFTPGKDPVPIVQEAGWAPGPVWKGGKSRPTGIRSPDRPARCQSLYRLSYSVLYITLIKYDVHTTIICRNESLCAIGNLAFVLRSAQNAYSDFNPYPTAFPYGNDMVLHFYQQQESSTTKTVHKVINKGLKTYV